MSPTSILILDTTPTCTILVTVLGATLLDTDTDPVTGPVTIGYADTRLLVHVNLGPHRSQRRGLELVQGLREEWGVTAPALFVSFEAEETLRATPHGNLLTQPGHGFLRLPATVEEIQQELQNLTPVAEPNRYRRSAVATALKILLEGPAVDPIRNGPGALITALSCWQDESPDWAKVAEYLSSDQWWQTWSDALVYCQARLVRLPEVPTDCVTGLEAVEQHLTTVATFAEQVLDPAQAVLPGDLDTAFQSADALRAAVLDLNTLRRDLESP